jgi:hypothetical protein
MSKSLHRGGALALVALVLVCAIVGAYAAVPSGASQYTVTPKQFAALNAKVNKLRTQVGKLNKTVNALGTVVVNCVTYKALGVARNGAPPAEGYIYGTASGSQLATALDVAPASSAPVFLLTTPAECASAIGTYGNSSGAASGERSAGRARASFAPDGRSPRMLSRGAIRAAVAAIATGER